MNLAEASLAEIESTLRSERITAASLTEHALERNAEFGKALNAYKHWAPDLARQSAKIADMVFETGGDLGPLQGIPVSLKDVFGVNGMPMFAGSKRQLPDDLNAEGPIVKALRQQLAVLMGKTHTVEFVYDGLGVNPHWGAPRNPWDPENIRLPGGSSSGAGVSLLEGSNYAAFGSDSAGSVRIPPSMTGTVGLKVSRGRWPLDGILPFCPTLDSLGPITRTVEDALFVFAALDSACDARRLRRAAANSEVSGLRIGVCDSHFWDDCDPGIAEGVKGALDEIAGKGGARLVSIDFPEAPLSHAEGMKGLIVAAEFYGIMLEKLPDWLNILNPIFSERLNRFEKPEEIKAVDYVRSKLQLEELIASADHRLRDVDVLVTPTVPMTPPLADEITTLDEQRLPNRRAHQNTYFVNLLDLCAMTMPVALDAVGMPVGLQLVAPRHCEERLLVIGSAFEAVLGNCRERLGVPPLCRP